MWSCFQTSRQEEEEEEEDALQVVGLGCEQVALAQTWTSEEGPGAQASSAARTRDAVRLELPQETAQSEGRWRSWDDWQRDGCAERHQP